MTSFSSFFYSVAMVCGGARHRRHLYAARIGRMKCAHGRWIWMKNFIRCHLKNVRFCLFFLWCMSPRCCWFSFYYYITFRHYALPNLLLSVSHQIDSSFYNSTHRYCFSVFSTLEVFLAIQKTKIRCTACWARKNKCLQTKMRWIIGCASYDTHLLCWLTARGVSRRTYIEFTRCGTLISLRSENNHLTNSFGLKIFLVVWLTMLHDRPIGIVQ